MPRLPAWRVSGIGRLCTPFGRRTTVGNPGFGFQPYHSPPSLVHPPCCGVDDSGRLLGGSGGARARVRARSPCSLSPGFRRARACWFPSSLALASSASFSSASVPSTSASSLSSASASGLGLGLCLWFSALDSSSASILVSACFWRARHWLVPRWWLPRAWPAGSALLADPSLSALSLGAPRRHFFGSDASQAAELSLLGFSGRGWHGSLSHARRRPGRRPPSWVSRARRSFSLKAGCWGARAFSC